MIIKKSPFYHRFIIMYTYCVIIQSWGSSSWRTWDLLMFISKQTDIMLMFTLTRTAFFKCDSLFYILLHGIWHLRINLRFAFLSPRTKEDKFPYHVHGNTSLKLVPLHTLFFSLVCSSLKNLYVENDLTCHFVLLVKLLASKWVFYIVMPCGIKTMTCASSNFNGKLWGSPSMCPIMWEAFHVSFFQSRHLDQLLSAHNPFGLLPAPSNIRHNEALSL